MPFGVNLHLYSSVKLSNSFCISITKNTSFDPESELQPHNDLLFVNFKTKRGLQPPSKSANAVGQDCVYINFQYLHSLFISLQHKQWKRELILSYTQNNETSHDLKYPVYKASHDNWPSFGSG